MLRPETNHSARQAIAQTAPVVDVLGVKIDCIDTSGVLDRIETWIANPDAGRRCHQICTVNPEFVIDARRDASFAQALARADLRVADGIGVVWAARLQGARLPERVTGSDGIYRVCERASQRGWSVFFLGAGPGIAARTADTLGRDYPHLQIAGFFEGSPNAKDWANISARLTAAQPDILLVAFGHPRQDFWIDHHRDDLPCAVAMGVGGAFDFVAGVTTRAPAWMRNLGLEWQHRLIRQPWRWRRMSKLPVFAVLAMRQAITRSLR